MAREYVSFPNANARDEFCAAVDRLMGLPADVPGPRGLVAHIETWCAVYDAGPGSFIARIDEENVLPLLGQTATIKNRGGQDVQVTLSLAGAQRAVPRSDSWTPRPPRGGLEAPAQALAAKERLR